MTDRVIERVDDVDDLASSLAISQKSTPINSIAFTLSALPPSINSLYQVIWSQKKIELKPECRLWKSDAKQDMPYWQLLSPTSLLDISVTFTYDQFYKNGKRRIYDPANLLKLLIDAIAQKYRFDDSRVLSGSWRSAHCESGREKVEVVVTEIEDDEDEQNTKGELILTKVRLKGAK